MNVLFICQANIGRSQAAMEFYNQLVPGKGASAGTLVDLPGQRIGDRPGAANAILVMKEHGVEMSDNTRRQVTEDMLADYDKIIVMAKPETVPDWLQRSPKTEIWTVGDPKGKNLDEVRETFKLIKLKVENLAK